MCKKEREAVRKDVSDEEKRCGPSCLDHRDLQKANSAGAFLQGLLLSDAADYLEL